MCANRDIICGIRIVAILVICYHETVSSAMPGSGVLMDTNGPFVPTTSLQAVTMGCRAYFQMVQNRVRIVEMGQVAIGMRIAEIEQVAIRTRIGEMGQVAIKVRIVEMGVISY